jgi:hypothetical protein
MSSNDDATWERWTVSQYISQWDRTVQRQRERVFADPDDPDAFETDVHLYAVALNQLVTMVEWARRSTARHGDRVAKKAIRNAQRKFNNAVPGIEHVRDIHEHLAEYERGTGKLQKKRWPTEKPPPLARWYSGEEVHVFGFTLNVQSSALAATALAEQVVDALGTANWSYRTIRVTGTP